MPAPINLRTVTHYGISSEKRDGARAITSYGKREAKFCSRNSVMCVRLLVGDGINMSCVAMPSR